MGIGYIFISNLIASAVMLLLLTPEILGLNSHSTLLFEKNGEIWFSSVNRWFGLCNQ